MTAIGYFILLVVWGLVVCGALQFAKESPFDVIVDDDWRRFQ